MRLLLLALFAASFAHATEDSNRILSDEDDGLFQTASEVFIPASEAYLRTQQVLGHFSVKLDSPNPQSLIRYQQTQSAAAAAKILEILDPTKQFMSFFQADGSSLTGFLDGGAKKIPDFTANFAASENAIRSTGLVARIQAAARNNPSQLPLNGLRIAIDPGHMGGAVWDERTGKHVQDKQGHQISEGLINLQTALLLENQLKLLGADTFVTHRKLEPVSKTPYEKLSLTDFGREELKSENLKPWFQTLIKENSGAGLISAFENSPQVKKLFSEFNRGNYFILREDLKARTNVITESRADITLIIHHDTGFATGNVGDRPLDGTKTYVVGDFEPTEFATQRMRTQLAKKMVDKEGWETSLLLNRLVAHELSSGLGIGFSKGGGGTSFQLEPGVFARNLGIPSSLEGEAVSYIEVFHYDDPNEFRALLDTKHKMVIDGVEYPYSDRLVTAADSIKKGVLGFVASYR